MDDGHPWEQRRIIAEVAVAFPRGGHLMDLAREGLAAEGFGGIRREAARLVVRKNLLQKMHSGEETSVAAPVAIALHFHQREKVDWTIIAILHAKHAGESEGDLVECPAIEALEVHGGDSM